MGRACLSVVGLRVSKHECSSSENQVNFLCVRGRSRIFCSIIHVARFNVTAFASPDNFHSLQSRFIRIKDVRVSRFCVSLRVIWCWSSLFSIHPPPPISILNFENFLNICRVSAYLHESGKVKIAQVGELARYQLFYNAGKVWIYSA